MQRQRKILFKLLAPWASAIGGTLLTFSAFAAPTASSAQPASPTSPANAVFRPGGAISGRVTAADTGFGLPTVEVIASTEDGAAQQFSAAALTDAAGFYTIAPMPAGNYRVQFKVDRRDSNLNLYLDEYYNAKTAAAANAVPVILSQVTPNIDGALARGGQISGRVIAADTHQPLDRMEVIVRGSAGITNSITSATTDASGYYTTTGLSAGSYKVVFRAAGAAHDYARQYYNDKLLYSVGDPVAVALGAITPNIDAELGRGGFITGTVGFGTSVAGNPNIYIGISAYDRDGEIVATDFVFSHAGHYTLAGLATDTYKLHFFPADFLYPAYYCVPPHVTYGDIWYNQQPDQAAAVPIQVTVPLTVSDINAFLPVASSMACYPSQIYLPVVTR